jgi:hypothetical protein
VGKPLGIIYPLLNIREFILQEKNLMIVMSVGNPSFAVHHLLDTAHTLKKYFQQ